MTQRNKTGLTVNQGYVFNQPSKISTLNKQNNQSANHQGGEVRTITIRCIVGAFALAHEVEVFCAGMERKRMFVSWGDFFCALFSFVLIWFALLCFYLVFALFLLCFCCFAFISCWLFVDVD